MNVARKKYLTNVLSPSQQQTLGQGGTPLTQIQVDAIHKAYAEAFRDSMYACAAVSGVAILLSFCMYRSGPRLTTAEARKKVVDEENARRLALREVEKH